MKDNTKIKSFFTYLMVLPAVILISFCAYGMIVCIFQAFGLTDSLDKKFTFDCLIKVLSSKDFARSLSHTFYLAFTETILALAISYAIALYIIKNDISEARIFTFPISIPHLVVAMMTIQIFAQNGMLSHFLHSLGIIKNSYDFVSIVNDEHGIGIIVSYVWKSTAYALSIVYLVLKKYDKDFREVCTSLGANYKDYIFDVLIPLSRNTLIFCFMVIFSYSFGSYEIPFLLGSTINRTIPILAYIEYIKPDNTAKIISENYNMIMFVIGILFMMIYSRFLSDDKAYRKNN